MENVTNEEEVLNQDTQPTEEELYNEEYEKAWSDEESEEVVEQPNDEDETPDEVVEDESTEDSTDDKVEAEPTEETEESKEEPSDDFAEVLKWKKKEIPVTRDELITLAQKGFDAEKKWQESAKKRPFNDIIDANDLSVEQLQTLADIVKSKNPEALALLAEQSGIDMFDAERKSYQPTVETKNYALDDVIAEINEDEDVANQMNDYVSSVPQSVKDTLTSNPDVLRGLNMDMRNGIGQKIMPEVIKQLAINPNQDFVELYRGVGTKVFNSEQQRKEEVKTESKPEATRIDKKKVGVSKKVSAPTKNITDDYDKAWDDDKHFNDVLARMNGF